MQSTLQMYYSGKVDGKHQFVRIGSFGMTGSLASVK
jgi:acyl-[acyl carrier protein]--UDP-N-acetylglucosamine O-acyltransferase